MKHQTTRQHYYKYKEMAKKLGVTLKHSEFYESYFGSKKKLLELYKEDPNLNNIPLSKFDRLHISHHRSGISLAENTCMYKHLIFYEILELEPEFID